MINYKRKAFNLSLTTSCNWGNTSMLNSGKNTFKMADDVLSQKVTPVENKTRNNSEYVRLKFAHIENNHSLEISTALARAATPKRYVIDNVIYSGLYNFNSISERSSAERAFSPKIVLDYSLSMPKEQYLWILGFTQFGHTNYRSYYDETGMSSIYNKTIENSFECEGGLFYQKGFSNGISTSINLDDYFTRYRDKYISENADIQTLTNNNWQASATFQQIFDNGLSYFVTAGLSGLTTNLGDVHDTQISPIALCNLSYVLKDKHRFDINGRYLHTVYDPSYKNDATIRTSFFETSLGNPNLKPMKVFQNTFNYNGRINKVGISATYDMLRYGDNSSNRYVVNDDMVYKQLVNDGNFTCHKIIVGASVNLIENKLKLNANETFSINRFNSKYRPVKSSNWRFAANATYLFGDWQIKGIWSPAFKGIDTDGGKFRMSAQYGMIINWKRGNWAVECFVKNFLHRYRSEHLLVDYGCVKRMADNLNDAIGRNVSVTLTYTLPYGRKTERDEVDVQTSVNSAILRPF